MRPLLLLACGILWACGSDSATPLSIADDASPSSAGAGTEVRPVQEGPLVVFLGDSLSAGLHLPLDEAFPAQVQSLLAAQGAQFRLRNAGVSGDTTAGGLRRLDWLLGQSPDVVVIELGGNDGLRGLPLETVDENLRAIVERVREAGAEVLLLGVLLPPNYGADYANEFAAIYGRLAEEQGLAFAPGFLDGVGGVPEMNLSDGLHPTAEGHARLAENVAPHLRAVLERLRVPR